MKHFKTIPIPYNPSALLTEYYQALPKIGFSNGILTDIQFEYISLVDNLDDYPEAKRVFATANTFFGPSVRFGFLYMKGKKVYGCHRDSGLLVHFPVITNQKCKMIIEEEQMHLPVGVCTLVNSRGLHTAYNLSDEMRVHLVYAVGIEGTNRIIEEYFPFSREPHPVTTGVIY